MDTPAWDAPIEVIGLSKQMVSKLYGYWVVLTLSDIDAISDAELLRVPGLGRGTLAKIRTYIDQRRDGNPLQNKSNGKPAVNAVPSAQGMTLRDWFAGQALAGTDFGDWRESDHLERRCYQVADAMLAAREDTP